MTPNSRSYLNHWTQPDTIVPDPYNPQDWDRYSYTRNNPVNYIDPSGNTTECGLADGDYCNLINIEYSQATEWQQSGFTHDEFVQASEAYEYYLTNPQAALHDAINDTNSYFLADSYSEYVLHQFYQPFGEMDVYEELDAAITVRNATNYWGLLSWLSAGLVFQSDKGFGGGSGFKLQKLSAGEIKMLQKAGINVHELKGDEPVAYKDLYKDGKGNIFIMLKGGIGEPDPTGININTIKGK